MNRLLAPALSLLAVIVLICAIITFAKRSPHSSALSMQSCNRTGAKHQVIIKNSSVNPVATQALRCDTLTIVNKDDQVRLMAFGPHEHHEQYDGVTERTLDKGQSFSITLDKTGTFTFHDHLNDSVQGTFIVR